MAGPARPLRPQSTKKASRSLPWGIWSGKSVSNRRPQPWQGCALPTELFPRVSRRSRRIRDAAHFGKMQILAPTSASQIEAPENFAPPIACEGGPPQQGGGHGLEARAGVEPASTDLQSGA